MKLRPIKEGGFTLIETMMGMALFVVIGAFAMELLGMIRASSEKSLRSNSHLELHVEMVRALTSGISGLKGFEFDDNLIYSINSSSSFVRTNNVMSAKELEEYPGMNRTVTSHRFKKRIDTDIIEYYSVCIEKNKALDFSFKDIDELRTHSHWPFIEVEGNTHKVNCCKRNAPNCKENIMSDNPRYVLQTFRYESRAGSIIPILARGAWGAVSGVGFFIFKDQSSDRLIRARALTFFNECLSQDIFLKRRSKKCSTSLRIKHDEIIKDFDYKMEGINQLGGDLSF